MLSSDYTTSVKRGFSLIKEKQPRTAPYFFRFQIQRVTCVYESVTCALVTRLPTQEKLVESVDGVECLVLFARFLNVKC